MTDHPGKKYLFYIFYLIELFSIKESDLDTKKNKFKIILNNKKKLRFAIKIIYY